MAAQDKTEALFEHGERLPDDVRAELLASMDTLAPALIQILEDRSTWHDQAPGGGWAPIHAVRLLGEARVAAAARPMVEALAHVSDDDYLQDRLYVALEKIGAPALEPLLAAHDAEEDPLERAVLATLLVDTGVRTADVAERALAAFEHEPGLVAGALGELGDARALPLLHAHMAALPADQLYQAIDLADAIVTLGDPLTEAEEEILCGATDARLAQLAHPEIRSLRELPPGLPRPAFVGGLLAAVAAAPEVVPPHRWIRAILDRGELADPRALEKAAGILIDAYNATLDELEAEGWMIPHARKLDLLSAVEGFLAGVDLADGWLHIPEGARCIDDLESIATSEVVERREVIQVIQRAYLDLAPARARDRQEASAAGRAGATPFRAPPRTPRNAPCPCGSGKKFKRCCG